MTDLAALLFIAAGALPGVIYLGLGYSYWRRRIVLEEEEFRRLSRFGYGYLTLFAVVGVWFSGLPMFETVDRTFIALGWIAAPALAGVLGIFVFADRQRLTLERWPSIRKMLDRSTDSRTTVRSTVANLSGDLNIALQAIDRARNANVGDWWETDRGRIDTLVERLRSLLKQARALEERFTIHLERLADASRDDGFAAQPLSPEHEQKLERLQKLQRDADRDLGRLLDGAVTCRGDLRRIVQGTVMSESR